VSSFGRKAAAVRDDYLQELQEHDAIQCFTTASLFEQKTICDDL